MRGRGAGAIWMMTSAAGEDEEEEENSEEAKEDGGRMKTIDHDQKMKDWWMKGKATP